MSINKRISHREISFAESFEKYNSRQNSINSSPSIAYESHIHSLSRERRHQQSPIHNLHYKYLPSSYKLSQLEAESKFQKEQFKKMKDSDERVGKMELINNKIKNILNSIEDEEKRKDYYYQRYAINIPQTSLHRPSRFAEEPKPFNYGTPTNNKPEKQQKRAINEYSNMSSIESEHYRTPLAELKTSNHINNFVRRSSYQKRIKYGDLSVKSFKDKDLIVGGRNVMEQIGKIQSKIQDLNKMKEESNIKLELIAIQESVPLIESKSSDLTLCSTINKKEPMKPLCWKEADVQNQHEENCQSMKNSIIKSQLLLDNPSCSQQDVSIPKLLRKAGQKRKKKNNEVMQFKISQNLLGDKKAKQPAFLSSNQESIDIVKEKSTCQKSRCGKGIIKNQRTKALAYDFSRVESFKPNIDYQQGQELKKFLDNISHQIKLDQYFRKAKQWFQRLKNDSKWKQLGQCFFDHEAKINQKMFEEQLKCAFSMVDLEQNPFYVPAESDFTLQTLCKAYNDCLIYWETQLHHQFDMEQLQKSNFKEENFDLRGRGYISMEDLSRFINCELDTYYRNRDIYLIYERFRVSHNLSFIDIVRCLQKI